MEKDLEPGVIKATQSSLGKYVKRPPLSEKLLKKPPFRFLHDIVTSVLKTTGFFEGLFDEEELVSDNVKDRDNKILFLNKVIAVIAWTTGKTLSVKASKIVAGQEPEKTNKLLQYLAQALDKNLSSNEAVKKYKEGTKTQKNEEEKKGKDLSKTSKKTSNSNKLTSKSSEMLSTQTKESINRAAIKNENDKAKVSKPKEKNTTKTESPKKATQQSRTINRKTSVEKKSQENSVDIPDPNIHLGKENHNEVKSIDNSENYKYAEMSKLSEPESIKLPIEKNDHVSEENEQKLNSSYTIADNLNSSLSSQDLMETENNKINESLGNEVNVAETLTTSLNDPFNIEIKSKNIAPIKEDKGPLNANSKQISRHASLEKSDAEDKDGIIRPPTANKSPLKSKTISRPLSVRPSSSRPGAPRLKDKHENILSETENMLVGKVNIIVENAPNEEEEDSSIIVIEQESSFSNSNQGEKEQLQTTSNQHGHLVQQILDSQKEYSHISGKTEIEWQFRAQKARDATNKEIEQLRFDIQALSRVANPLGKLLDHIQEDVEVMRQELAQWTKSYEEASKELLKQKAANEESLLPLYTKVKQLDVDIVEKHDKINDLKIIIHKNSFRIEKLLANGNVQ